MKQLKLIPIFIMVTVLCFIALAIKAKAYSVNVQVHELSAQIERKEYRNKYLKYEIKQKSSSRHVNKIARDKLKMKPPAPDAIVQLGSPGEVKKGMGFLALASNK